MDLPSLWFVFDVESVGLHGEGFAVAYVVVDRDGRSVAHACYQSPPQLAAGDLSGHSWVRENWKGTPDVGMLPTAVAVRRAFWNDWTAWKGKGAAAVADCGWPVEARFFAACVDADRAANAWDGPYPLHELASLMLAAGLDPLGRRERLPDELPEHDPLADARQSARLLGECLIRLAAGG